MEALEAHYASVPELNAEALRQLLNPEQLEAVLHTPGPQLILAGAGSGKTRALTYKIAHLLREHRYRPHEILAVTFTNKAAREMRERVAGLLGYDAPLRWMGTFHSVCARLLRFHAERLQYTSHFTIYDVDDQKRQFKKLLQAEHLENDARFSVDAVRHFVSRCKNQGMGPEEAGRRAAGDRYEERMVDLYRRYQDDLQKQDAMDFDDLIFLSIRLLKGFPEVRQVVAASFRYVLIDEYQDTNKAQYQLIQLLLGPHRNLVVVGDDDQSIYGWRGADIQNILSFRKDYPDAKVTKLERNYRSTANILAVAGSVIRRNRDRMEKTLWTDNPPGDKITLVELDDEIAEAAWVARRVQSDDRFRPGETAVFYRTNAQSRVLEDELRRRQIPYLIVGGIRFYERREVKDLLAYLRLLVNPRDDVSFTRAIHTPKRGIGDRSLELLQDFASAHGLPLTEALPHAAEAGVANAAAHKMKDFHALLAEMRARAADPAVALSDLVAQVLARSGVKAAFEDDGTDEALDRLANVEELVSAAADFTERQAEKNAGESEPQDGEPQAATPLEGFLQEIALVSDSDALKAQQEAVVLMTVHSAKGLEFPRVFVTGLEEGLFPLLHDEDGDAEEERRLFYVAATRAERDLSLSYARRRRRYGGYQDAFGSRFLREIDKQFLETAHTYTAPKSHFGAMDVRRRPAEPDPMPRYEDLNQDAVEHHPGQRVRHAKFGIGKVLRTEGTGESARVDILFEDHIRRTLVLKFAKLEIMD